MAKKSLSPEALKDLKANAAGILSECRRVVISRFPFSGSVMATMDLIPIRDLRCSTACTDGKSIYFDIEFLSKLTNDERMFVLAHELWHSVLMHFLRTENRNREIFNYATDMEVNQLLVKEGMSAPTLCVFPKNYGLPDDLNAEEYYELLLQKAKNESGNSDGNSCSMPSDNGSSKSNSSSKCKGQFDKHVYNGDDVGSEKDNASARTDKYGEVGFDEDFNPSMSKETIERIRESAVAAIQQIERQRGEVPGYLNNIANKLLEAKMPWRDILSQFVTRAIGSGKTTWAKPRRRYVSSGLYLPDSYSDKLKIAVGIDTSGSTANDMPRFLGELQGLLKTFGDYELHVIQCDYSVSDHKTYDNENPLDLENTKFEIHGYGGTRLHPIFEHIQDNELDVNAIVMFTDGEIENFPEEDAPEVPVLWMITKGNLNTAKNVIKFGEISEFIDLKPYPYQKPRS